MSAHFKFDDSTCLTKLGQGNVHHYVAPPLLLTKVHERLRNKETSCWTLWRRMSRFIYFFVNYQLVLCFMMLQIFTTGESSRLQADQSSIWAFLQKSHGVVIDVACDLVFSC